MPRRQRSDPGHAASEGAAFVDPLSASFGEQVAAGRDSEIILGDLGSNLAMSIYARPGAGLLTLGPVGWHDDYFIKLFQRLDVVQADIRGYALPLPGQPFHHASIVVNPADVRAGLHAVRSALAADGWRTRSDVAGRLVARAPGAVISEVTFGKEGNARSFRLHNFAEPEALRTWSIGTSCRLVMPRPVAGEDFWLEIIGEGFVRPPYLVSRPLAVLVNGVRLAETEIDDTVRLHVHLPAELMRADELVIDFQHPVCPSPLSMGVSTDARSLGIMFERVTLRRLTR